MSDAEKPRAAVFARTASGQTIYLREAEVEVTSPNTLKITAQESPEPSSDPVRDIHEFALNTNIRLSIRTGKANTSGRMWELASGTAAAWYAHRLLQRLAEVDPDGVQAFAELLVEEGEMPEVADNPVEVAERMGFDAQAWIDAEYARRETAS
ncbi:hypothetical protein [Streptomyces sp. DH8]|uniref:hypothetical protein n=1 Tax=Streptomyces sp. DH8 TaxID=2857008 RepID=UPI001E3F14C1|nr:hypothetical protein [Streptomyces sp. DH8]